MADDHFDHPRPAAIYDVLDLDRSDLEAYAAIAAELGAHRVLDVGCGTGTFALLLAGRGLDVTGVDPARGSLAVARAKRGAERVRWLDGDATGLPAYRGWRGGSHPYRRADPLARRPAGHVSRVLAGLGMRPILLDRSPDVLGAAAGRGVATVRPCRHPPCS